MSVVLCVAVGFHVGLQRSEFNSLIYVAMHVEVIVPICCFRHM